MSGRWPDPAWRWDPDRHAAVLAASDDDLRRLGWGGVLRLIAETFPVFDGGRRIDRLTHGMKRALLDAVAGYPVEAVMWAVRAHRDAGTPERPAHRPLPVDLVALLPPRPTAAAPFRPRKGASLADYLDRARMGVLTACSCPAYPPPPRAVGDWGGVTCGTCGGVDAAVVDDLLAADPSLADRLGCPTSLAVDPPSGPAVDLMRRFRGEPVEVGT